MKLAPAHSIPQSNGFCSAEFYCLTKVSPHHWTENDPLQEHVLNELFLCRASADLKFL